MKIIIISCFILFCTNAFSQQHPTEKTQCQMNVSEILLQQSFDIDEPVGEKARDIFFEMYEELNLIYQNESDEQRVTELLVEFNETLQKAENLNLNISMFQDDINYVSNITQ